MPWAVPGGQDGAVGRAGWPRWRCRIERSRSNRPPDDLQVHGGRSGGQKSALRAIEGAGVVQFKVWRLFMSFQVAGKELSARAMMLKMTAI